VGTFPRRLAAFREIVNARGESLRTLPFEQLASMTNAPQAEDLTVDGRRATINTIVESVEADRLRIVVQGFLSTRFVSGHHVALDGFYKNRDGAVAPMLDEEFWDYD
jgi:hypothetical protein